MKKKIFALIALAAAFVGCSKEASETPSPAVEGQKFVITASVGDPATRLGYVENDQNGFTARFTSSEKISLYFLKADNSVALSRVLNIDGYSISDDGRTAKFETTDLVTPTDAVKLAAYLYSGSGSTYTEEKATTDLSLQANLGAAQSHHILYTTLNTSDIKVDENGVSTANIKFAYKTALLRFNLTLPGVEPTKDSKTVITISNPNNTIHNVLDIVWGELASTSTTGDIVIYPSDTVKKEYKAIATACVWAADNFKDTKITVKVGDEEPFSANLELKKETLEAGKVYDVTRSLEMPPRPFSVWQSDEEGSVDFKYSGGENVTADWLSCKDGKISWTANTTGSPRTAKLEFKNGFSYEVYQIGPADFAGAWDMYVFNYYKGTYTNGAYKAERVGPQGNFVVDEGKLSEAQHRDITIGTMTPEEVTSTTDGNHTHNITIDGFSDPGLRAKSEVAIDYANKKAYLNIYFMQPLLKDVVANPTAGEHFTEAGFSNNYAWLMPALNASAALNGAYQLGFATLTQDNQAWYRGVVTAEGTSLKVKWTSNQVDKNLQVLKTTGKSYIYGIMVNPYSNGGTKIGTDIAAGTLVKNGKNAAYQYCYQGDMVFVKK